MGHVKVRGDGMTLEGGTGVESGSIIGMCMYIFNEQIVFKKIES